MKDGRGLHGDAAAQSACERDLTDTKVKSQTLVVKLPTQTCSEMWNFSGWTCFFFFALFFSFRFWEGKSMWCAITRSCYLFTAWTNMKIYHPDKKNIPNCNLNMLLQGIQISFMQMAMPVWVLLFIKILWIEQLRLFSFGTWRTG